MHVEFALKNREMGQGRSVREKSVRANAPIKKKKMKGAFSLNNLLVGTVWPPEKNQYSEGMRKTEAWEERGHFFVEGAFPLRGLLEMRQPETATE